MDRSEYLNIYNNEESHFFYTSLHLLIINLINKYYKKKKATVLDIGSGTGGLIKKMKYLGNVQGVDSSQTAIKLAKIKNIEIKFSSIERLNKKSDNYDIVTCIDVIYHQNVKSDSKALQEIYRVLKPKGIGVIRVPAYEILRSGHDIQVHTARRYTPNNLRQKFEKIGFKVLYISPINFVLGLISLLKINLGLDKAGSAIETLPNWLNKIFETEINIENWFIKKGLRFPFGQGLIIVAVKTPLS